MLPRHRIHRRAALCWRVEANARTVTGREFTSAAGDRYDPTIEEGAKRPLGAGGQRRRAPVRHRHATRAAAGRRCPHAPEHGGLRRLSGKGIPWADLLAKVFEIDVLACPECGSRMVE